MREERSEESLSHGEPSHTDIGDKGRERGTSGEEPIWKWKGQVIGQKSIDENKKQQALAACSTPHAALVSCLRQGFTVDCSESQKAFWECYAKHRGVRGNKIAAWFAPPSFSGFQNSQQKETAAHEL